MSKRGDVLELAVLGLLHESSMHGYELRKRLNALLGSFRAFSYGSLYPCLKSMVGRGWLAEETGELAVASPPSKRSKIVYKLTADGKEHFQQLLASSGPAAWEDENFGVHFAFFGRTDAEVRMRILEGRRSRLEERMESVRLSLARTRERFDSYTLELQRHGLESAEREVRWLNELIRTEHEHLAAPESASSQSIHPPTAAPPTSADNR
jgi:DNA-binding PadR family transcriptional regulator